jgi:toluene monooxygenase system protein A
MATFGALDEFRHTQIPLVLMHDLVRWDAQFDWTHKFYHTNDWVAIAGRHLFDELLLSATPIEFAIGTNFVFETGFTNLQFVGLSSLAHAAGDKMFEKMVKSIQTDEARHAQIGRPVLETVLKHDPAYAQYLVDKWFWRTWLLFSIVTGFSMDYLSPLAQRRHSFTRWQSSRQSFNRRLPFASLPGPGPTSISKASCCLRSSPSPRSGCLRWSGWTWCRSIADGVHESRGTG